jgi:putative ABC transport system permease protein
MRPKPPANGKRVWLERIPVLWYRLGFFSKVTARNIFRYKRRFVMTLVGVAGCSALLVTAFGLRDSIGGVADLQYESIVKYDVRVYLRDITTDEQRADLSAVMPEAHFYVREEAVTASSASGGLLASLVIPDTPENLPDYINLYSPATGEPVPMTSRSVLITEKLARVMGVSNGGSFSITYSDGKEYTADVTGIVANYIQHFIYMSPGIYTEIFDEEPYPNSLLLSHKNGRELAAPMLENNNVRAVMHNNDIKAQIGDSTDAMGIVTIVLIVLACALAFVVLFNLTNINISERIRELATLKVLGFNDVELAMYIYRENGVITLLGIVLGIVGGIFLHGYVITTVEIDVLKFPIIIHPQSYILAGVLSLAFAVFVNFVMNGRLARIDMVESLKNVE